MWHQEVTEESLIKVCHGVEKQKGGVRYTGAIGGSPSDLVHSDCYNRINAVNFSLFWRLGSPRSRHWRIRCLVRACFLVYR